MKVLIISTYYKCGGAELQALFEREILERHGDDALYLTFDPMLKSGESCDKKHLNLIGNYRLSNSRVERLIINPYIVKKIRRILDKEKPDFVHLHNITYAFNSIAFAVKDIYTVQTMHDYSYLCDKNLKCIRNDDQVCKDCHRNECIRSCYNNGVCARILFEYKYFVRKRAQRIRSLAVNKIISPSKCLTEYLNNYGYSAITINNAISKAKFEGFTKRLDFCKKRKILMLGSVSKRKGIVQLLNAYSSNEFPNLELEIIGDIGDDIKKEYFLKLVEKSGAKYLGIMEYSYVVKNLEETYALIIPSLWMENYPNVALEGMLSQCVVFGSNRGGIPEVVAEPSLLFDILEYDDIRRCLNIISNLNEEQRRIIIDKQNVYFEEHNTENVFYDKLMNGIILHQKNLGSIPVIHK